jgi:hypothetical protein
MHGCVISVNANELLLAECYLVAWIIACCPHEEGHKRKLQKLHTILHSPLMMFFLGHAKIIDTGTGKCNLKDVFNDVAQSNQQRGQEIFLGQVFQRDHVKRHS